MIYVTGDTHARFERFTEEHFPEQKKMTKDDCVIICGDFGGVWDKDPRREALLDRLEELPFTVLFITGNHDNYDLLETYPVSEWNGGKVQHIRPHVIHLMRGQVFTLEGKTFFTMGGAECHDIWNGVQDPEDPNFLAKCLWLQMHKAFYRVKGESWWAQELPSAEEYEEGRKNLQAHGGKVDFILSHCAPTGQQEAIVSRLRLGEYPVNALTDYLQEIADTTEFRYWLYGHYHRSKRTDKYIMVYDNIIRLV